MISDCGTSVTPPLAGIRYSPTNVTASDSGAREVR